MIPSTTYTKRNPLLPQNCTPTVSETEHPTQCSVHDLNPNNNQLMKTSPHLLSISSRRHRSSKSQTMRQPGMRPRTLLDQSQAPSMHLRPHPQSAQTQSSSLSSGTLFSELTRLVLKVESARNPRDPTAPLLLVCKSLQASHNAEVGCD